MDTDRICLGCMKELSEGVKQCPYCGYNNENMSCEQNIHHLKPYTILAGKYLVGKVLGEGGFGITYIGMDLNLEMKVAIKEFYPNGFVSRDGTMTSMVTEYAGTGQQTIMKWKEGFLREARILAKCSNLSGIVGVKDFFQENNTAYIIMEYLEGETLKEHLKRVGGKMPVEEVLSLMRPVISSLAHMHEQGLIHRDISPDNIMMLPGGNVKLLDLGAARDYATEGERSLSVMLKPGYAPEEQYRTKGKQGPWSDVYALCATIYKCITGVTPPESMERMREDDLQKPSKMGIAISKDVEECILKGMEVYSEKRIQNMSELQSRLYGANNEITQQNQLKNVINKVTQSDKEIGRDYNTSEEGKAGSANNSRIDLNKWKWIGGIICLILVVVVIVISGNKTKVQKNETQSSETESGYIVPQRKTVEKQEISLEEEEKALKCYDDIVNQFTETNTLPEIEGEIFKHNDLDELYPKECQMAVQDIDMDCCKELVFQLQEKEDDITKERQIVYKYNTQQESVQLELDVPRIGTFYDNSTFRYIDASMDNIYSDEDSFVVMMYNEEKQCFEFAGEFIKWDKGKYPDTIETGEFPSDMDSDQDGILYNAVSVDGSSTGFVLNEKEYQMWENQYFDGANALDISYTKVGMDVDVSESEETISSYDIIIEDFTWNEAYQDCISRGGHLLRIESEEEYERIVKMIDSADLNSYVFWLGGKKDRQEGNSYRWIRNDGAFYGDPLDSGDNMKYWLDGEPSYYDDAGNEENCMNMFYLENEGRWVWNDVPNDILAIASFYSGQIAYICEYEN